MTNVAALDCGTNSTRLLVVDDLGQTVERRMTITRLGQGVDASGVLRDDAVERTLDVLREYREVMDRPRVTAGRLAATSAARDAANGAEFLGGGKRGVRHRRGAAERRRGGPALLRRARRAISTVHSTRRWSSTSAAAPPSSSPRPAGAVLAHSMQVGCVRVTERAMPSDPPTREELVRAAVDDRRGDRRRVRRAADAGAPRGRSAASSGSRAPCRRWR